MSWHSPSEEEVKIAQSWVDNFLGKELDTLKDFMEDKVDMTKEQLQNSLYIISMIIHGAGAMLPFWSEGKVFASFSEK